jgi:hypothetical protein
MQTGMNVSTQRAPFGTTIDQDIKLIGDRKIIDAVKQGVNVVMWFSINLAVTPEGKPTITNGPDMDCVADIVREIAELGLDTVHLISIGGWNSPHPDTSISAEEAYEYWNYWNRNIAARPDKGFVGFDGFDWDIEGDICKPCARVWTCT